MMDDPFVDRMNYGWIRNIWTDRITHLPNRAWKIGALTYSFTDLRDGTAYSLVAKAFGTRTDFRLVPVSEESDYRDIALDCSEDLILVGRHNAFALSRFGTYARWLHSRTPSRFGDFDELKRPRTIQCRDRTYSVRELPRQKHAHKFAHRLCTTDYGLILFSRGNVGTGIHSVLSIGGVGSVGTLGAAAILANRTARDELARQVHRLLVPNATHNPAEFTEVCVRIDIEDEADLAAMCQDVDLMSGSLPFSWRVEYVVIKKHTEGFDIAFRRDRFVELQYFFPEGPPSTMSVRAGSDQEFRLLAPLRGQLILSLLRLPKSCTIRDLCARLEEFRNKLPGSNRRPKRKYGKNTLSKLVEAVNDELSEITGVAGSRYIHFDHKHQIYVLDGLEFAAAPAKYWPAGVPHRMEESEIG